MSRLAILACSIVTGFILCLALGIALQSTSVQVADKDGTITFYGKDQGGQPGTKICTLAFVTEEYIFNQMDECINDDAYSFKLENVRSATTFGFYDDEECTENTSQKFYFTMKTMKDNLTMDTPVQISNLNSYNVGEIIPGTGGVRLESKYVDGQVDGKLTCVKRGESTCGGMTVIMQAGLSPKSGEMRA